MMIEGSGSRRPKKHVDTVDPDLDSDPDPQHCFGGKSMNKGTDMAFKITANARLYFVDRVI
jgi:hypothetical protein